MSTPIEDNTTGLEYILRTVNALPDAGGGLTTAQISALDGLFKIAAYTEDASGAYAAFRNAFGIVETYTVTSGLLNIESNNPSAIVAEGKPYTATLTAADGYEIGNVTVTMGGVDITADVYAGGVINIAAVTGDVIVTASAAALATDIMSNFKYLGPTTYSPGTYTAWCPTGLIYDETRDVYAHFMNVHNRHYETPNACELWFNTINPETLSHTKPVFIARTAEATTGTFASAGALGCCIKNGVYYMFSKDERGYYKSVDGGATWTHEEYETGPASNPWGCYVLSSGRMVMGSDVNDHKVYYSDDDGKNWTTVQSEHFNEPTFVDFGNGTIMAICRENKDSSNNLQPPWMHISYDNGENWTPSVAMTTVGYMGNNNCNAYVHDNYVELFVGCRNWSDSPQWDENKYKINQYVLDMSKGPVDEFEFVNTVYQFKDTDNPHGFTGSTALKADDFSTPVIAIKDKSHALLSFYGPMLSGVTHHLISVGNVPVDSFEIPSIIPETYNASQTFSGAAGDTEVTVCESYGLSVQDNYPSIINGYLKFDDIEDGGFVHIRQLAGGNGDATGTSWLASPFVHVKGGRVLSATRHTGIGLSPVPKGLASVYSYPYKGGYPVMAKNTPFDRYAFIDGDYWWVYYFGTWFRVDSGDCDVTTLTGTSATDNTENLPYRSEGLTTYKTFNYPNANFRKIAVIEYDKASV